jgi:CRP-like cAMP-binding protein
MEMSGDEQKAGGLTPRELELAHALPRLTPEQVAQVSPRLKREAFAPGEVIIRQGDLPDRFYIVIFGQVEIIYEDLENRTHSVDMRKPGEFFGETALLQNRPRSATVRALEDKAVELLVMEGEDFKAMMDESKATEMHLAQEMIQRLIRLADVEED